MSTRWWPLFDLRLRTPRLELRPMADTDFDEYGDLLDDGVHPPEQMPFTFPWTDESPPALQRKALQYHWRKRAEWTTDDWGLPFGVWENNRLVGQQDLMGRLFGVRRTVETGSWVGMAHQGRGIGKEMRAAVLHLAFHTLGAERAETKAFDDNPASLAVSRSLGYVPNGDQVVVRRGESARFLRYVLFREEWSGRRRNDIVVEGFEPCRSMFGVDEADPTKPLDPR